jgi:chloride channel 7
MRAELQLAVCCRYTGHTLAKFIITMVSGVLTGVFAVALSSSVGALTEWKLHTIQSLLDDPGSHRIWIAFLWHWCFSCVLVVFAVALVGAHA